MNDNRYFSMMPFHKPLKAHLTIEEVNGIRLPSTNSKEIDVLEIQSFGLLFSTDLDFPIKEEAPLTLKIKFYALGEMTGEILHKRKQYGGGGGFEYELKAIACNLQYLKACAPVHEAPVGRISIN